MFGTNGGARRGEMMVIGALQHNFKSGTALEMFKSAALYNRPYMRDPNKKPMLMRISFENPIEMDIINLYKSLAENETGIYIEPKEIDIDHATRYVIERLQVNGYHLSMCHIDPSDYTYHDLFDRIEKFEAEGYEIHMLNVDYLAMMSKKGCAAGPAGVEIRDLYRRVRNFIAKKGIFFVTPHQLSPDAKRAGAYVVATGRSDYPNQVNNSLAFPGIFRGALDRGVTAITDEMKLAAAKKIASLVKKPTAEMVIPPVMTPGLVKAVASVIK
jgi:hypothetical protein